MLMSKTKPRLLFNTSKGTKLISDVLFVLEINRNMLNVGQMLHRNYVLFFKERYCTIMDPSGFELMIFVMKNRSFHWKPTSIRALSCSVDKSKRDRIYDLKNEKVVLSRDVNFDESSQRD